MFFGFKMQLIFGKKIIYFGTNFLKDEIFLFPLKTPRIMTWQFLTLNIISQVLNDASL